jgi:RNA polymerase sigma factor (sigma-70 family)
MSKNLEEQIREEGPVREFGERYWNVIRRAVFNVTRDEAAVEDIVQDTLLRFIQRADTLKDNANLELWLWCVARNAALEHLRRAHRAKRVLEEANPPEPALSAQETLEEEGERPDTDIPFMLRQIELEPDAVSQLEVARHVLEEAATHLSEELKLAEQVRTQLAEVDEIIEGLGRDREEIERLKEETRSNISELQRMIAA